MKKIRVIISTIIAIMFGCLISSDINSDFFLSMLLGDTDKEMSDFYNRVYYYNAEKLISEDIVIINIDSVFQREEIAWMVDEINACNPSVIALDVLFTENQNSDEDGFLKSVITDTHNLVIAQQIDLETMSPTKDIFSEEIGDSIYGFVNLVKRNSNIVRSYMPFLSDSSHFYLSFASKVCQLANPESYDILKRRQQEELIIYSPTEFIVIDGRNIADYKQLINGKIVLVGSLNDFYDTHLTPLTQDKMPGIKIWAHIINNILKDNHIDKCGEILGWILSLLVCLLLSSIYVLLNDTNCQNLGVRVVPIFILIIMTFIGCWLFKYGLYINITSLLLLSALSIFVLDVWYALEQLLKK